MVSLSYKFYVRTETNMAEIKNGRLTFKMATYNIAAQSLCLDDPDSIARDIADADADIVGLQEVDMFMSRSGERDMLAEIAAAAAYPHYRFIRAIDYKGGQYGTAILSKHPIEQLEVIDLDSASENRSLGRFVINVLGERINYFNTHLSCVEEERLSNLKIMAAVLDGYESYVITADFNTNKKVLINAFPAHRLVNPIDDGIDNIIMTEDFDFSSPGLAEAVHSDHGMLTALITKSLN